jgi:hypothetical protein
MLTVPFLTDNTPNAWVLTRQGPSVLTQIPDRLTMF